MISIHAPREGSDNLQQYAMQHGIFQSTLPVRGATTKALALLVLPDISIHAPREGSDGTGYAPLFRLQISIHAPREGSD